MNEIDFNTNQKHIDDKLTRNEFREEKSAMKKTGRYISTYCTGCGLCHSVQGTELKTIAGGFPSADIKNDESLDFYTSVCPVFYYKEEGKHDVWGIIKKALVGYSADDVIRFQAASGGALTEICCYLLENNEVDAIIHTTFDPDDQTKTISYISTTIEQVMSRCGSRYGISVPLKNILQIVDKNKKYAFIGKPCDVMALRRYLDKNEKLKKNIIYLLSFFCAGEPSAKAQDELLKKMGTSREQCDNLTYRGNGWPGLTTAITKDGRELKMEYKIAWGQYLGRDIRYICRFCMDGTGDLADIVCADFWQLDSNNQPDFSEHEGRNIIIARTDIGKQLLDNTVKSGRIHVEEDFTSKIDSEFHLYQPAQLKRKGTMKSSIMAMKLCGRDTPEYSKSFLDKYASHTKLKVKFDFFIGIIKRIIKGRL